ncbi:MAG: hypothetical protein LBD29_01230 [Treponema sp.]|jgi:hypothetical protein|nr:hypothetical protein [Treponema sp.]
MKRIIIAGLFIGMPLVFLAAQQSITDVVADTVSNYLSPLVGKGQEGEKLIILHFKSPTAALNDWAIDRFTEIFIRRTAAVERRNRPVFLNELSRRVNVEIGDAEAASYGARVGVSTVFTGGFTPSGRNWALGIRAINVASKRMIWSKNYIILPGETFTRLATPSVAAASVQPAQTAATAAAPVPVQPAGDQTSLSGQSRSGLYGGGTYQGQKNLYDVLDWITLNAAQNGAVRGWE